jgi:D-alanyl-D-alanine carboxypeptidase
MRTVPLLLVLGCQPARDLDYAALMEQAVDEGLPGVALYVSSPRETFDGAAGERILGEAAYQTTDPFRIASNSKTFLGVVAAQMAAEGRLDLDAPLSAHLPASLLAGIENADRATLRQALTHQSGIFDYLGSDGFWEEVDGGRSTSWTAEEALQYAKGEPADFAVGEGWSYSNSNYLLAGLVIDAVAGRPHAAEIRDRILDPLGLRHTFYEVAEPVPTPLVHGYTEYDRRGRLADVTDLQQGYGLADGGIVSTAADLATFLRAVGSGDALLSDEARALLLDDAVRTGEGDRYGLGISRYETRDGTQLTHGGGIDGYSSDMLYYPASDTVIVAFTNISNGYFGTRPAPERVFTDLLAAVERRAL